MKKALILGMLNPQSDAVRYLKQAGWWVIGCGHRREGRAIELVDQFELVDLRDLEGLEALARRENVDLFYSTGSETALLALAVVPPRLGLPTFVEKNALEITTNKIKMREFLNERQIGAVPYRKITCEADLEGWDVFPAMVKPVDSAGQRGVFRADTLQQAKDGLERSLGYSPTKTVVIEQFLDGPEVSANAFVIDSKVVFNEISDRLVVENYPGGIPRGHVLPSQTCTGETLLQTKRMVEDCIHALNIQNGPVYFQMKLTSNGPRILECMLRFDGCHIWRLIKTVGGVDLIAAALKLLAGEKPTNFQMQPPAGVYQIQFFLTPPNQPFKEADHPIPAGAVYSEYRYLDGQTVRPVNGYLEVTGYSIIPVE